MKSKNNGFTVIELSIVMVLMGLVALIFLNIFPKVQTYAANKKTLRILDGVKEDLVSRYKSGALRRFEQHKFRMSDDLGFHYYSTQLTDDSQGTPQFRDSEGRYLGYIAAPALINNDICATSTGRILNEGEPLTTWATLTVRFCLTENCTSTTGPTLTISNVGLVLYATEPGLLRGITLSGNTADPIRVTIPSFGSDTVQADGQSIKTFINTSKSPIRIFTVQELKMMANCPTLDRKVMNIQMPDATAGQPYTAPLPMPLRNETNVCLETSNGNVNNNVQLNRAFGNMTLASDTDCFDDANDFTQIISNGSTKAGAGEYEFSFNPGGDGTPTDNGANNYTDRFILYERFFDYDGERENLVTIRHNIVVNVVAPTPGGGLLDPNQPEP